MENLVESILLHSSRRCSVVSVASPHSLHEGESDTPILWRKDRVGKCPVKKPISNLRSFLLNEVRPAWSEGLINLLDWLRPGSFFPVGESLFGCPSFYFCFVF